MRIGVSSYSFNRYLTERRGNYLDILDIAREIGFDGVEFIGLENAAWGQLGDPLAMARDIRDHARQIGLEIPAYTVGANLLSGDPAGEVARLCRELDTAAALGAKVFRHDASFSLPKTEGYTWETGIWEMVPLIREIADYGASLGIRTCSENHGMIYQDAERVERLMAAVGHPNYGWLVDMGNFLVADGDCLASVKLAAPRAVHVHAKDFLCRVPVGGEPVPAGFCRSRGGNLWRGTVLGHGVVPVSACISALLDSGYNGWVSLEFEGLENNLDALRLGYSYLSACVGDARQ